MKITLRNLLAHVTDGFKLKEKIYPTLFGKILLKNNDK